MPFVQRIHVRRAFVLELKRFICHHVIKPLLKQPLFLKVELSDTLQRHFTMASKNGEWSDPTLVASIKETIGNFSSQLVDISTQSILLKIEFFYLFVHVYLEAHPFQFSQTPFFNETTKSIYKSCIPQSTRALSSKKFCQVGHREATLLWTVSTLSSSFIFIPSNKRSDSSIGVRYAAAKFLPKTSETLEQTTQI